MTRKLLISLILAGACSAAGASATTTSPFETTVERAPVSVQLVQRSISAREAKSIALREVPGGEVVDISRDGNVYRVRVVARSGRVVDVLVDASSGRVVG